MEKDIILIAKMYTGEYINESIGHEIINFFKPDGRNEFYGYIIHKGIVKNIERIHTILLVSDVKDGEIKIIAKIENPEFVIKENISFEEQKKEQIDYIKKENIKYGGVLLNEIKRDTDDYGIYITYKANKIEELKEEYSIILGRSNKQEDKNKNIKVNWNIGHQYGYLCENGRENNQKMINTKEDYEKVYNLIKSDRWKEKSCREIGKEELKQYVSLYDNQESFLDLIEKNYDETIFSNMLYHYFYNKKMFKDFAKEVLGINVLSNHIKVEKEKATYSDSQKGRIDIFVEDEKNKVCIVIENKIKSGINGRYYDNDVGIGQEKSQLTKYMKWIEEFKEDKKCKYEEYSKYYFIFVPNYKEEELINHIRENDLMPPNKENGEDLYKIVTYEKIFEYFNKPNIKEKMVKEDRYYIDFLKALSKHIYTADKEMERKFVSAIKKCKTDTEES